MTATASTTRTCEFCGRELRRKTINVLGHDLFAGWEQCGCEGAVRQREREAAEEAEREAKREEAKRAEAYRRAGIKPRYLDADHPLAVRCAADVTAGRNVYVWGDVGTHKTLLMSATARLLVDGGTTVRSVPVREVLDGIKASFDGSAADPLPALQRVPVLMLDDLGKENPTAFALERIFALVDERYDNALPTFVTTQYRPARLIERLALHGDADTAKAIVSRLRENCRVIEMQGPDRRLG